MAVIHLTRPPRFQQNTRAPQVQANLEAYDQLSALLMHLESQISLISADGLGNFDAMTEQNRRSYLWAMAESITAARELCDRLEPSRL
jgi:hypothetical protein